MGTKALKQARTLAFTLAATLLAVLGHTAASNQLPGILPVLAVTVVGLAGGWIAGSAQRSIPWITVYLVVIQAFTHLVLWATTAHRHADGSADPRMLIAHALAAGAAAAILTRSEQIIHAWYSLTVWASPPIGLSNVPSPNRENLAPLANTGVNVRDFVSASFSRRGPPLATCG